MMYTRVHYLYRDASNYKQYASVLLEGEISDEEEALIEASLDGGETFVPTQIGWPHPGTTMIGFPGEDDHVHCELDVAQMEQVADPSDDEVVYGTTDEWVRQMLEATAIGWRDH
jgi:hypothetical protein